VHDGYRSSIRVPIRLCSVSNLASGAVESDPAVRSFYIKNSRGVGANRHAIVNSRVSGAVYNMVRDMKASGLSVSADSTYRSMERQEYLCAADTRCRAGNHQFLAKPGTSNHQMGLAIDFTTMPQKGVTGATCAAPATAPNNPDWKWLNAHAAHYGFKQYAAEPWHWEALAANGC
jgi:LAS superfamily LD-carboxypeptidase LdcB